MRGLLTIRPTFCALAALAAAFTAVPAMAQTSYSPYAETASGALARYVRTLGSDPKDFGALIGAGRAALALGDTHAAAGFFARADEVNPRSPLPHAGMGAVSVTNGEAQVAMPYFTRALQLGAAIPQVGCDRGLAYDLLGQQSLAQADYRAAMNGPDADEARRRLALSLAISKDKAGALQALAPLLARRDPAAGRAQAFVLALTGDSTGAMRAFDAAMPGSWSRVEPFLKRLPTLRADQKAAAVNLGIFLDSSSPALASASVSPPSYSARSAASSSVTADRLVSIEEWLRAPVVPAAAPAQSAQAAPSPQLAYAAPVQRHQVASSAPKAVNKARKLWLQLASGPNAEALPNQFKRIKSRNRDLFDGISGYVARGPDRARLVIGPFRGPSDAETFAEDLQTMGIDAFSWTNSESDTIVPLGTE